MRWHFIWVLALACFSASLSAADAKPAPAPAPAPGPAPAPAAPSPARASPRATLQTFLEATLAAKQGQPERMADATACMDFSTLDKLAGSQLKEQLAWTLLEVLDRTWHVDLASVPDGQAGPAYRRALIRDGKVYGELIIARQASGEWLFDSQFVASLTRILHALRGVDRLDGLSGAAGMGAGFWIQDRVPASLRQTFVFLEYWQWIGLLALILMGLILKQAASMLLGVWLRALKRRRNFSDEDCQAALLDRPLNVLFLGGTFWLGLRLLNLPPRLYVLLAVAVTFFLSAGFIWAAYRFIDLFCLYLAHAAGRTQTKMDDLLAPLIRRAMKVAVVAFGIVFIAGNLGLDVTTMLAGLGLGGLAFALAAKDTVENLFGSVTILLDRPFQIGDWVVINGVEGTIEEVGFRSTRIRTSYQSLVTLPNSRLVSASIDNYGARSKRRISCVLSLTYSTPPERIEAFMAGVRELIARHPHTCKDSYYVHLNAFAASSLDILLNCFLKTPDWGSELKERERLFMDIILLAERLGVQFAFPTQTLHIDSMARPEKRADAGRALKEAIVRGDPIRLGRDEAAAIASRHKIPLATTGTD